MHIHAYILFRLFFSGLFVLLKISSTFYSNTFSWASNWFILPRLIGNLFTNIIAEGVKIRVPLYN